MNKPTHSYFQALRQSRVPESKTLYSALMDHSCIEFIQVARLYNELYRLNLEFMQESYPKTTILEIRIKTVSGLIETLDSIQELIVSLN